jgi:type I restriction enzyme S subunit
VSWSTVALGSLCDVKTGKKDVNEGNENGKYPFFTCAVKHTFSDVFSFDCEAILVAGNGAVGQTSYYNGKFEAYQRTYVLCNFVNVLPQYLLYVLNGSLIDELSSKVLGNTIPYIKKGMLAEFQVPLPPLLTQQKIVTKLTNTLYELDKALAATETNARNAEDLLVSYISQSFNNLKNDYQPIKIGDICSSVGYGSSAKSDSAGEVPVLRMGNILNGELDFSDLVFTSNKDEIEKYILSDGDVLFNRTNSPLHVGKSAVFFSTNKTIFAGYLIRINYDKNKVVPEFLAYYLNSKEIREYGYSVMSHSVNQANINGTKLKNYPFICPPLEIQKTVVDSINRMKVQCDFLIENFKTKNKNINSYKKSILQKAFNGGLVKE